MNVRVLQVLLAIALTAVLLVLLGRALLLGESFGALSLVATAAAVTGLGALLRAMRGRTIHRAATALTLVGLASLAVSLGLTVFIILTCC